MSKTVKEQKRETDIIFLCDGACPECEGAPLCYKNGGTCEHTFDVTHARNFFKVPKGGWVENGDQWLKEIE